MKNLFYGTYSTLCSNFVPYSVTCSMIVCFSVEQEKEKSVPFIFVVDGGKKPISVKLMLSVPLEWGITTMRDVPRPISRFWKVNNFSAS